MNEIQIAEIPDSDAHGRDGDTPDRGRRRSMAGLADGILTNIRNGTRMAFFRGVGRFSLAASPGAFAAIAVFDILLHFLLTVAQVGPKGEFTLYPLAYAVFHIPLMLLAGLCIARLERRDNLLLELPVAYIAIGIPIDLLAALYEMAMTYGRTWVRIPHFQSDHFYGFYGWWVLAVLVATLRLTGAKRNRLIPLAVLLTLILVVPLWNTQRGELWQQAEDDTAGQDTPAVASEKAFYAQSALLENALAKIRPGAKGDVNIFFVGFAGYGSQDVFMKEIETVRRLFLERFDTSGHSMILVNNPGTVLKYPIATATSLERTLKRVGQVMDRDRDILFLYLTSHGSEDHRLSVGLGPLELQDIDPAMLRRMLDESGIKWRVIAISACYSGGFIEPLKGPETLVMTSTDAFSNSFGCSNDSDLTWFGKALFDEELRHTYSFTNAFERAAASIRTQEKAEGEDPSNPQIYVGKAIRPRLDRLEIRLEELERLRKQQLENVDLAMRMGSSREVWERCDVFF